MSWTPTEKTWLAVGILAVAAVVWLAWPRTTHAPVATNSSQISNANLREDSFDRPAEDVTLTDLEGRPVTFGQSSAEPALAVVFWRTDCGDCRQQLISLREVDSSAGRVYAVNVGEDRDSIRDFLGQEFDELEVLLDPNRQSAAAYSVDPLPSTTFLHNGRIVGFGTGALTAAQLTSRLSAIGRLP